MPTEKNDQNCVLQFIIITNADELLAARLLVDCSQLRSFSVSGKKANRKATKVKYNILGPWIVSLCVYVRTPLTKQILTWHRKMAWASLIDIIFSSWQSVCVCVCNLIRRCTSFAFGATAATTSFEHWWGAQDIGVHVQCVCVCAEFEPEQKCSFVCQAEWDINISVGSRTTTSGSVTLKFH